MTHVLILVLYKLCLCLTSFLTFFLTYFINSFCFLSYLFNSLLVYFVTYLSTSSRIDPFHFKAVGHSRWPNWHQFYSFTDIKNIFNNIPSQNILNFIKKSTYMINYNFYKRNLTQIIHFQLNNLPNFSLLIQSKSTVIVMFFFFSYLTPRINAY